MLDTGLTWFLETNAALAEMLGRGGSPVRCRKDKTTGIFPVAVLGGAPTLPYIVYQLISSTPNNVMEGVNRFQSARVRFSCYGSNFTNAKQLANTLKQQLQGFKGVWYSLADNTPQVEVQGAWLAFWGDNAEPDAHNTILTSMIDFNINYVDMQD
jgi:hypothetical protein